MLTNLANLFRLVLVVAVLGFVIAPVALAQRSGATQRGAVPTASTGSRAGRASEAQPGNHPTESDEPRGDPMAGIIWIAVAVAILVFLVWVAMRIGDVQHPSDKIPN
ncbi:MAG TPA: hypothetical protein VKE74_30735 [Gemmataceae bacterium]|nr:hypothetical protein [Gemmataceae bacterium]